MVLRTLSLLRATSELSGAALVDALAARARRAGPAGHRAEVKLRVELLYSCSCERQFSQNRRSMSDY